MIKSDTSAAIYGQSAQQITGAVHFPLSPRLLPSPLLTSPRRRQLLPPRHSFIKWWHHSVHRKSIAIKVGIECVSVDLRTDNRTRGRDNTKRWVDITVFLKIRSHYTTTCPIPQRKQSTLAYIDNLTGADICTHTTVYNHTQRQD